MVDERLAGSTNFGILTTGNTFRCFSEEPTGLKIEPILALLGVTISVGHGPVVVEIISAVASVRIDDSIDKNVQQFFQAGADTSIPGDIVKRGERLHQTEMPVVGFSSERALRIRPIFVILNP